MQRPHCLLPLHLYQSNLQAVLQLRLIIPTCHHHYRARSLPSHTPELPTTSLTPSQAWPPELQTPPPTIEIQILSSSTSPTALLVPFKNKTTLASPHYTTQISCQTPTLHSNFSQVQPSVSPTLTYTTTVHSILLLGKSPSSSNYGLLSPLDLMVESVLYDIVVGLQLQL